ncbi:MAG: PAS-domain containing protein [Tahibacter sp.]
MLSSGVIIVAALIWLALMFAVALYGERHPRSFERQWAVVYALSLAIHCTSWTFYGTVTQASRSGWWLPPTFVGAIALYLFGAGLMVRLVRLAREYNAGSLADLIAARLGRHSGLAALVTAVMLIGIVPYTALQLKAVAMSYSVLSRGQSAATPAWQDSALYVALLLALFAMLFGTRRVAATAHNRGLVLAIAFESLLKLGAMLALGAFLLFPMHAVDASPTALVAPAASGASSGFAALILLGATAMFGMPHQFHAGVVECRDVAQVKLARWLFPAYLILIAAPVLPLARLGDRLLAPAGVPSDLYVLALPLAQDQQGLALIAFLGGLSAATSMVVVAVLALSVMVVNHFVAPLRVRAGWGGGESGDLRGEVLTQRRIAILAIVLLAWAYSRLLAGNDALADIGAISFSALAGLLPPTLVAVYRPQIGARAVGAGLLVGTTIWLYILLPALFPQPPEWLAQGPLGIRWLAPDRLAGLDDWSRLGRAVTVSLLANALVLWLVAQSRHAHAPARAGTPGVDRATLLALATRFLPIERIDAIFHNGNDGADIDAIQVAAVEHELAAVIGASSARLLLDVLRRRRDGELDTIATIVGEAAEDLRVNQRVLSAALANMSQGICVVDADLRVVAWNRRYAELFDYPDGLLEIGRPIAALTRHNIAAGLIGDGAVDSRVQTRLSHMQSGAAHLSERRFPDGTAVEIRGNPMPGGGYVATFTDVTAFRRAEEALTRSNETLEQRVAERTVEVVAASEAAQRANEAKTHFLAAVSHDLLQPLHAAQLFAHALRPDLHGETGLATARHLDGALAATESLLAGLLDIARLEGGKLQARFRDFAIADVLDPLAAEFSALAQERGIRLSVVKSTLWTRSDAQLLRRVLQNFLANALRYAEDGRVLLGCRRSGDSLRIEVWDTGPGITLDEQRWIFEAFRRGSAASGQGLGLGLAIAERMAGLLGHELALRSWPGRGSVFSVRLPLATRGQVIAEFGIARATQLPAGTALVLDNDPDALAAMTALLHSWQWRVFGARAPAQALRIDATPDLLLLDFHLDAGVTGLDVLADLRARHGRVPVIVLTADRDTALRQRLLDAEVSVLYKPLKPLALRQLMRHFLAARRDDPSIVDLATKIDS